MIYSANFGDDYAMFEPAHGSTPKYAGKDKGQSHRDHTLGRLDA